jgi:nitric oxide reductase activation protein
MHKRNMVITTNDISQRTKSFLYPLNLHRIRQGIPQMLQLLIRRSSRNKQTILIADGQTADNTGSGNGGVADGDDVLEFGLEDGVEVLRGADCDDSVGVC